MLFLGDMTLLLAGAVLMVPLFKQLGLGSVLGYLATGVMIGPYGFRFFSDVERIMGVSELGIILLLFLIGLELQPSRVWTLRKSILGWGGAQMLLTSLSFTAVLEFGFAFRFYEALAVGVALSLSSTAFVLQIIGERKELTHSYGRSAFSVLLFQDLAVIPFLAALPFLGKDDSLALDMSTLWIAGKVLGAFAVIIVVGVYLIRPIFRFITKSQNHEIFTAAALLAILGTALLMESVGLSLSLGSFLAGVLLANSEYRHELEANIAPFESLLLGLFFIAVGMSANFHLLLQKPLVILFGTLGLIAIKALILGSVGLMARQNPKTVVRFALALAQGGEFAFVLFNLALEEKILTHQVVDSCNLIVILSMALTPILFLLADRIAGLLPSGEAKKDFDSLEGVNNAVIIAGFGRVGQIVGRILRLKKINFTALELNHEQVDFVRKFGNKLYYGDATRADVLRSAAADKAKVFVLAISNMDVSVKTALMVRKHFPNLKIYARARNRQHAYKLMDVGVDYIMRETFLSSLELSEEVLKGLGIGDQEAKHMVSTFREHDERAILAAQAVHHDERLLIDAAKQFSKDLEAIFEQD